MSCKQCCARAIKLQTLTLEKFVESQFAQRVRPWRINKQWKGNLVWYHRIIILRDAAFLKFLMHIVIFLLPSFFEQLIRIDYTMSGMFYSIVGKWKYFWYTKIYNSRENLIFLAWFWDSNDQQMIIILVQSNKWAKSETL